MINDIHEAFAHPVERSEASVDPMVPVDRISLRDHIVTADIGAFQVERGRPQRLRFNVVVEVVPLKGPVDDDVDRILSYDRVTEAIAAELADERLNLLETLAENVALRVLAEPQAIRVFVRIEKLDRGSGALGVEIVRRRDTIASEAPASQTSVPHPRVVYLGERALGHADLNASIDQMAKTDLPLVLCVGRPAIPAPKSSAPLAQRRIDLLAIEQNAWVLAGLDKRCIVVGTRTELDWAMRHGQISVWAPSKIVLDAVDGPDTGADTGADDDFGLVRWFAGQIAAAECLVLEPTGNGLGLRKMVLS